MSFNAFAADAAIRDRLSAAPLAAATQGAWNTVAPEDTIIEVGSLPIIIITTETMTSSNSYQTNMVDLIYRVNVFDHVNGASGDANAKAVLAQVYGDSGGTDNAPTYGLARWTITGVAGMADAFVEPLTAGVSVDGIAIHCWWYFKLTNQET